MSRAMARSCKVFATVMTRDLNDIPARGIWARVEYPTLKALGRVDSILGITVDASESKTLWKKSHSRREVEEAEVPAAVDMTVKRGTCGADDAAAKAFDVGGSLPVDW